MNSNTFSLSQLVHALFSFLLKVFCYYASLRDEQVLIIKKVAKARREIENGVGPTEIRITFI